MNTSADKLHSIPAPRPSEMSVPFAMLPYLMNRVTSRANQLWVRALREHGLTIGRWQVLSVLSRFDGSRIGTIADLSGGEQPAVSRVVDQMVRDGLVSRRPSLQDSRAVEIWMTDAGRAVLAELMPEAEAFVHRMLRNLEPAEIRQLSALLERIFSDLQ